MSATGFIPDDFDESDSLELLKQTHSFGSCLFANGFIISNSFIKHCVSLFKQRADDFAYKKVWGGYVPPMPSEDDDASTKKKKRRGGNDSDEEPQRP